MCPPHTYPSPTHTMMWWCRSEVLAFRRQRQEDQEFKVVFSYRLVKANVSSRDKWWGRVAVRKGAKLLRQSRVEEGGPAE